jgi:hypothetical protein
MEHSTFQEPHPYSLGSVRVNPGTSARLRSTVLYDLKNKPKFRLVCNPDLRDAIQFSEKKLTDGTVYYPVFYIENRSKQVCDVTVWWAGGGWRLKR